MDIYGAGLRGAAEIASRDLASIKDVNIPGKQIHFIGFRDDRYWNAVKVFGRPHFIHRGYDLRGLREIGEEDTIVFAEGEHDQEPRKKSYNDIEE